MTPSDHEMLTFLFVFQILCIVFAVVRGVIDAKRIRKQQSAAREFFRLLNQERLQ